MCLLYATTTNHFSIGLWHETKSRLYMTMAMTNSVVRPRRSSKELPKATFEPHPPPKKRSLSLFGGLLPIWSTTALWIPAKALHLRSILSKSIRFMENWNTWSQHGSTERAQFSSTTVPDSMLHNQRFKNWTNWAMKFGLFHHIRLTSHQPTTTSSSISTMFYKESASTTSRRQKCFPRVHWNMGFYASGISKLTSRWQKCVDCNGWLFWFWLIKMCLNLVIMI